MSLRRTPLFERHDERGATLTEFGGWEMPVQFESIRAEHRAVREDVGVFDVSHMTEIDLLGPAARDLAQRVTTADVDRLAPGESQYTLLPDTAGTLIDDAILYRLASERYLLVANAGKDDMLVEHLSTHRESGDRETDITNTTEAWGMLAVQGPTAGASIPGDVTSIDRLGIREMEIAGSDCWCARTGYTGEDGFEILVPWEATPDVDAVIEGTRCGLGARDTLRLEMGYVLAGNEFDRDGNRRSPYEAGLGFAVDLETEPPCLGHETLRAEREQGTAEHLVGLVLDERGVPRAGYPIVEEGERIGTVTSGTMSPTLERGIGLGYVPVDRGSGAQVGIEVRGTVRKASIEDPPFVEAGR